ncbi:MAG TPA: thiamine pyrophosphate-binding protein [Blastocatellia bacterium]|nr:thiamine pyrophosphate-binding protein [Blastocatellia bacterium]
MKQSVKLFLDHKITRRTFVSRMAQLGLTSAAAAGLAHSLEAHPGEMTPGRIVEDLSGGEVMAEFLLEWKIPYVFGLGGSEEVGFLDAMVDRLQLQYVQGLHESSVTAMADGYARTSGQTAFINLHSVAGTAYALGQIVNAYKDRVPLVITAGDQSTKLRGSQAFLEAVNLAQLPREYTRWHWDVLNAQTIPEVLRRAFLFAQVPPGGPTFITFSKDLWEERVKRAEILPRSRSRLDSELYPDPDAIAQVVDLLVNAQMPVIVAGRELSRYGGVKYIREISELLAAPVCSDLFTSHSPIAFPTRHPQYVGYFAEDPAFPNNFDLFWSVGGTMFTIMAQPAEPLIPQSARVIHTSLDGAEIGRNYPVDVSMLANVNMTAAAVLSELKRRQLPKDVIESRRRRIQEYTQQRRQKLEEQARRVWNNQPISSARLSMELNRRLDPNAIVVVELPTEEQLACSYLEFDEDGPGRRLLTCSGGCLGWGVAAAIGAKIAEPGRQVVALVGDGSFQFGVQALWSAARYEVPVGVVIWNNNGYQANRHFLHLYGGRAAATGRYVSASLDSPEIDHVSIAKGYGVEAERVTHPDQLASAFDRCFRATAGGRPYLLDVKLQRRYGGADSKWYDFFSVARKLPRQS